MLSAAAIAFQDLFTAPFRKVLAKSVGLTLLLLAVGWVAMQWLLSGLFHLPYDWMDTGLAFVSAVGIFLGMIFLIPPISTLVAGFFLDEVAEAVERSRYPSVPPGRAMPLGPSLVMAARFFGLVLAVNFVALLLLLVPGVNLVVFLVANGYLLGREYFQLAALRHQDEAEADALRRRNGARVFFAGLLIAGFMAVPFLNILGPLFGTAFMVHMHKRVGGRPGEPLTRSP